ncbi:unnamed protein product [Dovyalis caffra]|uniref:Uncharacterized protein n=1 Tax=Dovyalis caffra TaxID=77055 RepID=A0AAV1QPM2_9ROSI|nr:unnamed protein product [Dovyalis caffra]
MWIGDSLSAVGKSLYVYRRLLFGTRNKTQDLVIELEENRTLTGKGDCGLLAGSFSLCARTKARENSDILRQSPSK